MKVIKDSNLIQNENFFPFIPAEARIIETLSGLRNFKIKLNLIEEKYFGHQILGLNNLTEISLISRGSSYTISVPYNVVPFLSTVPPGELYTPLEKMFLIYDYEVWIGIVVTLLFVLMTVQVISLTSTKIKKFVFGRDVSSPTMCLISTFLNGDQHQLPGRNFARFNLLLFIFWSLIIRTCYQSTLYAYLQSDMRKPAFTTIEELRDNNFTSYGVSERGKVFNS